MSKHLKNTLIYTIGNVLTALSAFILLPVYTSYLSVTDVGITNSMQTLSGILIIFLTLALDRSLFRIYYGYTDEKDKKDFLGTIFLSILVIGFVGSITCFLAKDLLNELFPNISFYPYFAYTILFAFLSLVVNFSQIIAQVKQNSIQFISISLSMVIMTASCNLILIIQFDQEALGFVKGLCYGAVIILPFVLLYIHRSINYTFQLSKLKAALAFSLPIFPSLISAWVLNLSDRVFINKFFTEADVGIYSIGFRLASLIILIAGAIFMAYNPLFYDIANRNELSLEEKKEKLFKINSGIMLIIGTISLGILSGSDIILKLFFRKEYLASYDYISIFSLSFILAQIGSLFNLMIYQNKKTKPVALIAICCAGLNLVLNYFLIPRFGVYFAAVNNLICAIVNFICIYAVAKKNFYVKTDWNIFLLILGIYFFIYFENILLMHQDLFISILLKFVTMILIIFLLRKSIINVVKTIKNK